MSKEKKTTNFLVARFGQFCAKDIADTGHVANAFVTERLGHEFAKLFCGRRTHRWKNRIANGCTQEKSCLSLDGCLSMKDER